MAEDAGLESIMPPEPRTLNRQGRTGPGSDRSTDSSSIKSKRKSPRHSTNPKEQVRAKTILFAWSF